MTANREGLKGFALGEAAGDFSIPLHLSPPLMWQRGWGCFQWGVFKEMSSPTPPPSWFCPMVQTLLPA